MKPLTFAAICTACIAILPACMTLGDSARPNRATTSPNVVDFSTEAYAFQAPDTINAGWATFRFANHGDEIHYAHAVRLDSGRTVDELIDAYAEAIDEAGPRPTWVTRFGGPGGTSPGASSSVTQYIEPGRYVWICPIEDGSGIPHFVHGEVQPFVVRAAGPPSSEPAPQSTAVIRLVDYAFAFDAPPSAGRQTFRVENAGSEPHDVALVKLAPEKTIEDIVTWMQDGEGPPPVSTVGGVAAIAAGMEAFFEAYLSPGEYALVCFVTAPDGRTHIEHGMIRQFSVD